MTTQLRTPRRGNPILIAAVGGALAVIVLLVYFLYPRTDPLPPWVRVPSGFKALTSRAAPTKAKGPQYYLRLAAPGDPQSAITTFINQLPNQYKWDTKSPRPATGADLTLRTNWTGWIQKELRSVSDASGGYAITFTTLPTKIYIHAWPIRGGGAVVEVIEDQP